MLKPLKIFCSIKTDLVSGVEFVFVNFSPDWFVLFVSSWLDMFPEIVTDGKNSPREIFTSCFVAFKLALSAFNFELFLNASDKVFITSCALIFVQNK